MVVFMVKRSPVHDLSDIKALVRAGEYGMTRTAVEGMQDLYLDQADVVECVVGLAYSDFWKSMPSEKFRGKWQDAYKTRYATRAIYVKLQIGPKGVAVISFKQDEDPR